jgi:hypothetical protein
MIHRRCQHIGAQHHAGAAARWGIIDAAVLVSGEIANLDAIERPFPLHQRAPGQAHAQRAGEHLGIEGQDSGGEGHGSA